VWLPCGRKIPVSWSMKITASHLLLAVACSTALAFSQQLRLEDVPSNEPTAGVYQQLPLDENQRTTLRAAVRAHEYTRAEELLANEITRQPKSQVLLTTVGHIFFLDGKYLNCAVAMKKAEALAPLAEGDRFTLALSYIIMNHRDWARPELEKLQNSDPDNARYPYWLGRIEYDSREYKAAAARFQKALSLDTTFMKAYDNLGLCYEALAQYDDATRIYNKAILLNRSRVVPSPWPPLNLGTLLVKLGRLDEAETCLQESLKYDPHFPKAHYEMGILLDKQGKEEAAIQELLEAARYDPVHPEPHYLLGQIYARTGEKSKADAEFRTFQKLKGESSQGHSQ
jgi:tetratricopeptide (TPR) repeat protein